ncbi:TPA: ABC transporter permease subunit [Enterococcus faecalis]|uniref:ABC transporter permease n=1 Tax=Enterococcus faecalis TaxID=1351 RepID=UPI000C774EC4|nr:ABC transporter permease [Enterococcus faecalis]EGO2584181.1 ABC transporter permease subunit [Enterococcus faecalis]EGO2589563.1 ABC transporter permease subunit [Enterococcus faecalis]EGO2813794.1 ABC transporter permease subunit [Enterococcus faecalis]EGO9369848.1 ABC transporter permease [Enterococcus faecalis]EGS8053947.1 ABC transporter permease subunit [Enterococcus faecalis]
MVKNILQSEIIKFFSYNWCLFGTVGTILVAPVILFFSGIGNDQPLVTNEILSMSIRNFFLSQAGLVIIAASFFGQEYSNSYLRTTLLTIPARIKLITTKLFLLTVIVWIIGLFSSLICLGIGIIQFNGSFTLSLILEFLIKVIIAMLSWTQITWITVFLTIITKSHILPIAIMFSLILGLSQMLFAMTAFAKYLPHLATMNLFFSTHTTTLLNGSQGLLVQSIWSLFLSLISFGLIQYRDVR